MRCNCVNLSSRNPFSKPSSHWAYGRHRCNMFSLPRETKFNMDELEKPLLGPENFNREAVDLVSN